MASERDMQKARELLSDGIHAETFTRVADALAEARAEGAREATPAQALKPWHDTPVHACTDGTPAPGPIAPVLDHPADDGDLRELRCCACGEAWVEDDERKVVHAWWSAGAWRGQNDG